MMKTRWWWSILPLLIIGCATSQTVHWGDDLPGAASRVAALGAEHKATIDTRDGQRDWGTNVSIAGDSLHWTRTRGGGLQTRSLAEVESISFATRRHGRKGAVIGALTGVAVGVPYLVVGCSHGTSCSFPNTLLTGGLFFGAVAAAPGWIIGMMSADKTVFVREDP